MKYEPSPMDVSDIKLTPDIEMVLPRLARNTHEIWSAARLAEGWKYAEKRSDRKKTTPLLVPYDMLPGSEKEYDQKIAMNIVKSLIKLGFEIRKSDNG